MESILEDNTELTFIFLGVIMDLHVSSTTTLKYSGVNCQMVERENQTINNW